MLDIYSLSKALQAQIGPQRLARAVEVFQLRNAHGPMCNEDDRDDGVDTGKCIRPFLEKDHRQRPIEVKVADGISARAFHQLVDETWEEARFRRSPSGELFLTSFTTKTHRVAVLELRIRIESAGFSEKMPDVKLDKPPPGEKHWLHPDLAVYQPKFEPNSGIIVEVENTYRSIPQLCLLLRQYVEEGQARVAIGVKMWQPAQDLYEMPEAERAGRPVYMPVGCDQLIKNARCWLPLPVSKTTGL